jgi:type IV fimbrial biogenesis protein FimT
MGRRGFTLVELLIAIGIAGAVLTLAVPAFRSFIAEHRARADMNQLIGAIAAARTEAILRRRPVTLCPGTDGQCAGRNEWHLGQLVFLDLDRNGAIGDGETLIHAFPSLSRGARVQWRSFRNRSYLMFMPRGYTAWQNGSLLYCPMDGSPARASMIILNAQGRTRRAPDTDGDGISEDASGRPLACAG